MKIAVVFVVILLGLFNAAFGAPQDCSSAGIAQDTLGSELGDGFVILTWEPSPSFECVDRYQISVYLNDEGQIELLKNLDLNSSDARGVVVGELQNGLNYLFVVTAFNQFGSGIGQVEAVPGLVDGEEVLPQGDVVPDSVTATVVDADAELPPIPSSQASASAQAAAVVDVSPEPEPMPSPAPTPSPSPEPRPSPEPLPSPAEMQQDNATVIASSSATVNVQTDEPEMPEEPTSPMEPAEPEGMVETMVEDEVPEQPRFVTARCALDKCCIQWRKSLLDDTTANYYVVGKEYRAGDSLLITRGSETIDYSAGLVFADKIPDGERSACVQFEGLEMDTFYRFQVVGVNEYGYGEPSRWSIASKTKSEFFKNSLLANDCGCDTTSINAPEGFVLQDFQAAFPGYTAP
eukprot:TRINITY_DN509_c1_g1_i1.p1 TRINITY_DN509_c1_g1~~TRINITY_DN509_c1_g1_i1.p1  ORF type:complete len:447 (-),score=61.54 TRINITY_DN509_c1_g1_i1:292-1506(-)